MVIFNSYVSLPEGTPIQSPWYPQIDTLKSTKRILSNGGVLYYRGTPKSSKIRPIYGDLGIYHDIHED